MPHWAPEHGGRGLSDRAGRRGVRRAGPTRPAPPAARLRPGAGGAGHPPVERGGHQAALPPADPLGGRALVPALLRAGGRIRPGIAGHHRGARRRRVGDQRPEGLDHLRPRVGDGHAPRPHRPLAAEAQGDHLLRHGHAGAGGRHATPRADDRGDRVQRGLPHRRAGAGPLPHQPRGRGVGGDADHARRRAHRAVRHEGQEEGVRRDPRGQDRGRGARAGRRRSATGSDRPAATSSCER